MITVTILINGNPVYTRSAVNISPQSKVDKQGKQEDGCIYRLDDGSKLIHNPDKGAIKLAQKMLSTIKET